MSLLSTVWRSGADVAVDPATGGAASPAAAVRAAAGERGVDVTLDAAGCVALPSPELCDWARAALARGGLRCDGLVGPVLGLEQVARGEPAGGILMGVYHTLDASGLPVPQPLQGKIHWVDPTFAS